jgi:oligopeptidase B
MNSYSWMWVWLIAIIIIPVTACHHNNQSEMKPPVAKIIKKELINHGYTRVDNYYWLNERENPEVIAYLKAENDYTKAMMKHSDSLEQKLYNEMVGRIKQTDMSVPYRLNGYYYYTRYEDSKEYPVYCRKKGSLDSQEEIMIDGNKLAEGHDFLDIQGVQVSLGNRLVAYSADTVSRRIYTIYIKNLENGELLPDKIPGTAGNFAWANDNQTIFYATKDETLRPDKIWRHKLGDDIKNDVLVYQEKDSTFNSFVYSTKTRKYVVIASSSTLSDEYRFLDATRPTGEFTVFQPRQHDLEYSISDAGDKFYIRTNFLAKNFRLMEVDACNTAIQNWKEIIPQRDDVLLEDFSVFKNFLAINERKNGSTMMRIIDNSGQDYYINFKEEAYAVYLSNNPEFETDLVRYSYTSLTTPTSIYDFDTRSKTSELLKRQEVVGGYNPDDYFTERLFAPANDGKLIPISLVYKKGLQKDGNNPLLLSGYGSYGFSSDPYFSSVRLSLLDRGFIYAIAHVRGGEELGRNWYEDGKLMHKKNTFTDFINCAEYLVNAHYTSPQKLYATGGSAGGLLIGAVVNMRPDLFKGAIAAVPFVDVVTTMLDESIPLTTGEYDEWGNPNDSAAFFYMLSYSPYDNVEAKVYPALLVTTGLHDSQVQYWEPAKWVAKLRALKTNDNPLYLWTNMDYGHGGASGRFQRYKEIAMEYVFLLNLTGIRE